MGNYDRAAARKDVVDTFQPSQGQKDFEDSVSKGWNKLKGLVGAGDEEDAMGAALKKRREKLED